MCEVTGLLPAQVFRARLKHFLIETPVEVLPALCTWDVILDWMIRYGDHEPDWADAELVLLASIVPRAHIWSYDKEFWTIWRRPNGSHVPMAISRRA